uniref:SUN domain-containing protein n=1 Tax=Mesocestoides corti TaxID=53468 RepID=A0A5K3F7E5_MESCO
MDESVVNELSQPNMPTFQEFHAKVLGENQQKRRQDLIDDSGTTAGDVQSIKSGQQSGALTSTAHSFSSNLSKHPPNSPSPPPHSPPPILADGTVIHPSSLLENGNGGKRAQRPPSLRVMRNIAASECGAKLLQASPSAKHAPSILVNNNDEYMNQPCASEKWFIIETCEPVQLGTIQIANYELFSSRCKTFRVYVSDRYPAKQWDLIGTFEAMDVKGLQTFHIGGSSTGRLIKYVKFELLDHYGNEHFCPITMVRLFGLGSDELDETVSAHSDNQAGDDVDGASPEYPSKETDASSGAEDVDTSSNSTVAADVETDDVPSGVDKDQATLQTGKAAAPLKGFSRDAPQLHVDPPVNQSSVDEVTTRECVRAGHTSPTNSPSFWHHATRFIVSMLRRAIGSSSALGETSQVFDASNGFRDAAEAFTMEPTSRDFCSIVYLFSTVPACAHSSPLRTDRGLCHLFRCIVMLDATNATAASLPLAAPHRAWADCTTAQYLLNFSTSALPEVLRLVAAYRNLTGVFGHHPSALMGKHVHDLLPQPVFLQPSPTQPSTVDVGALDEPIEAPEKEGQSSVLQPTPHPQPTPSESPAMVEPELPEPAHPPSASPTPEADPKVDVEELSTPPAAATASTATSSNPKVEEEVVLPAAMGGSWKEKMYMRLNNQVLQLQSDVSVSMRYLEELSQSYKKQTERLSASFNLTTAWLKATAKGAEARDLHQQERINYLEAQLTKLLHILAGQRIVTLLPHTNSSASPMSVPRFRRPISVASSNDVGLLNPANFHSLWSVFFKSSTPVDAGHQHQPASPSKSICPAPSANASLASLLSAATTTAKPPCGSLLSPQASLLFRGEKSGRGQRREESGFRKAVMKARAWLFVLFCSRLQTWIMSETFRLFVLHLVLAVVSQILVYLLVLRRLLSPYRRVSSGESESLYKFRPPLLSSQICELCRGDPAFLARVR